jgi:hypothetical protein
MFTKSEVVSLPSVVSDDLFQSVNLKISEGRRSQFQNFRVNFCKFDALFSTRFSRGRLSHVLLKKGFENAHGFAQNRENVSGVDIFRALPQRGRKNFNHIVQLTSDET